MMAAEGAVSVPACAELSLAGIFEGWSSRSANRGPWQESKTHIAWWRMRAVLGYRPKEKHTAHDAVITSTIYFP